MLFHTLQFAVFFFIVYVIYSVLSHKWQNHLLLAASYVFYGAWEWHYLSLILASTLCDYWCGLKIASKTTQAEKRVFVYASIIFNVGLLCVFKYYDFFAENFQSLMNLGGIEVHPYLLNVALPIGISFYTFQTISYTVDVYRGKLPACKSLSAFALYVSFFPQLVAGPIERGTRLLPQILQPRKASRKQISDGCYFIFWGLFLKVALADNLADIADAVFQSTIPGNGAEIVLGIYAFAFQIFCDFCGYSLMAIGLAGLMGIELMENFRRPYLSKNISDFWRRWHISLSSWFRDYVFSPCYIHLQRCETLKKYPMMVRHGIAFFLTLLITEFLLGLWHGAGWNYVVFGVYHGLLIFLYYYTRKTWNSMNGLLQIILNFQIVCFGWLIFRASSFEQFWGLFTGIFSPWSFAEPRFVTELTKFALLVSPLVIHEIVAEWRDEAKAICLAPRVLRPAFYTVTLLLMIVFGQFGEKKFIYFQF